MSRTKYWLLTFFKPEIIESHQSYFEEIFQENDGKVQYVAYQIERCPKSGRPHVQAYLCLRDRVRLSRLKKLVKDKTVHCEPRRGSHQQALDYCTKEDTRISGPFFIGKEPRVGGSGEKFNDIRMAIERGCTDRELADEYFAEWIKYFKGFREYRLLQQPKRDFKTEVRVYYGPSGVGKSRRATHEAGIGAYRKPLGEWWDGYDGVSNVIIDDFYGWLRYDELLRCLDRYPHSVPIKGGFVNFAPKLLIITSNVEPRQWYDAEKINEYRFEALLRRLDVVEYMEEQWTEPPNMEIMDSGEGPVLIDK